MQNCIIDVKSRLYNYQVEFVKDFSECLKCFSHNCVYVIDRNVFEKYREKFMGVSIEHVFFVDAVEENKNMDVVLEIINFWSALSVKKNWKVICFGGGITQDVTTVAANLFLRNIEWYFFPTTLLSMCDSCIGGKCGINLGKIKNQIGVFYPPKKIFIDIRFLDTLSHADYLNGWGEILKFSLTNNEDFYNSVKGEKTYIPCVNIERYIRRGLEVKKEVIEADEFEADYRRVLNYGHTFGHALEAYTNNTIPHGQGVIWGIDVVNYIAYREGLIDQDYYLDIKKFIKDCFLVEEVVVKEPRILFEFIKCDKKVKDNRLYFAMLDGRSHLCIRPMMIDNKLEKLFDDYLRETNEYYRN